MVRYCTRGVNDVHANPVDIAEPDHHREEVQIIEGAVLERGLVGA